MANLNSVNLIGRLGADPETHVLDSGQAVVTFNLAINEFWKKDGERHERTEWIKIEVWGTTARQAQQLLTKGREIHLSGRLKTRKWEKDGETRFSTSVVGHRFQLLGPRPGSAARAQADGDEYEAVDDPAENPEAGTEEEEIPF